jgi:large subunit ribosomal protein L15
VFEAGTEITPEVLTERGLVHKGAPVKVLGRGELDRALTVRVNAVSESARSKIEQAGGTVTIL